MCICRDLNVYVSKVERLGQRPLILATAISNVKILVIYTKTNAAEILLTTYLNSIQVYQHIFYTFYLNCVFSFLKYLTKRPSGRAQRVATLITLMILFIICVFISLIFLTNLLFI